jgi:hypothetical protein
MARIIKTTRTKQRGWAIETGVSEAPYAVGYIDGGFSLFNVREKARRRLEMAKTNNLLPSTARVVRVSVSVTTIGHN